MVSVRDRQGIIIGFGDQYVIQGKMKNKEVVKETKFWSHWRKFFWMLSSIQYIGKINDSLI